MVEDDEDDFPTTRSDGDFLHNANGNKEKCKYIFSSQLHKVFFLNLYNNYVYNKNNYLID